MKDWLNTETAKRPPVLVVVPQEPQTQNFLLDVKYTDFSGIQDIPYDYPRAKCFIVPPFKPLMYTSLFSPSKSLDIYALRGTAKKRA